MAGKIKDLQRVICIVEIAISVVAGIGMIGSGYNNAMVGMGLAVMIVGSLVSWIGSFFAYGFGELIENTTVIAELAAKPMPKRTKLNKCCDFPPPTSGGGFCMDASIS